MAGLELTVWLSERGAGVLCIESVQRFHEFLVSRGKRELKIQAVSKLREEHRLNVGFAVAVQPKEAAFLVSDSFSIETQYSFGKGFPSVVSFAVELNRIGEATARSRRLAVACGCAQGLNFGLKGTDHLKELGELTGLLIHNCCRTEN